VSGYEKNYLTAALEYYEYMKIPLTLFPRWIIKQYGLSKHQLDGWVHLEMRQAVWGLPQAGILANKKLKRKLAPSGYCECIDTPGLWKHESRPLTFTLVVDDFGVKYEKKDDAEHLIASIKSTYRLTKDWTGNLYCSITLDWDYVNRTVDISMPGYIKKNYKNTTTYSLDDCKHARTHQHQRNLVHRRKTHWKLILSLSWMQRASNVSNK
jgi:hypothetical protein